MNEALFAIHVAVIVVFGFIALRMGKAALTAWVALQAVLANLFVVKQMSFLGFQVTCSDVFAVGSVFGLNLLREYYGKDAAKKALWSCFFSMAFFVAMAEMQLRYIPGPDDTAHPAFDAILSSSPRLLLASLSVFLLVQYLDLRLFSFLKEKARLVPSRDCPQTKLSVFESFSRSFSSPSSAMSPSRHCLRRGRKNLIEKLFESLKTLACRQSLSIRNALSLSTTQFLDTFLFSIFGLWGIVANLSDVILISFLIKLIVIALISPLVHFSERFAPDKTHDSL